MRSSSLDTVVDFVSSQYEKLTDIRITNWLGRKVTPLLGKFPTLDPITKASLAAVFCVIAAAVVIVKRIEDKRVKDVEQKEKIAESNEVFGKLEQKYKILKKENETLKKENEILKEENEKLKVKLPQREDVIIKHENQIENLRKHIEESDKTIADLREEVQKKETDYDQQLGNEPSVEKTEEQGEIEEIEVYVTGEEDSESESDLSSTFPSSPSQFL